MPTAPAAVVADPNVFFGCYLAGLASAGIRGSTANFQMAKEAWDTFTQLVEWANTKAASDIEAKRKAAADIEAKRLATEKADRDAEAAKKSEGAKRFAEKQQAAAATA